MYGKCERTHVRCILSTPICVSIFDPSNINNIKRPSSATQCHHPKAMNMYMNKKPTTKAQVIFKENFHHKAKKCVTNIKEFLMFHFILEFIYQD
jgi:hypothetical protein